MLGLARERGREGEGRGEERKVALFPGFLRREPGKEEGGRIGSEGRGEKGEG